MNSPIQRILVPLDPSDYAQAATLRACEISKAHFAQIEGLVVLDTPEIRSHIAALDIYNWPAAAETMAQVVEHAKEDIEDVCRRFSDTCEAQHASHQEVKMEGLPPRLILEASALFDLTVIGLRTFFQLEDPDGPGDSLAKILDRTVTPVLAVPKGEAAPIEHVAIAYDGSLGAARALRDFVHFAQPFDFRMTLFSADGDLERAQTVNDMAAAYLRSNGHCDFETKTSQKPPFEAIESELGLLDSADLFVAGIHSRKFFKDAFVGSFANQLIEHGEKAVFLSH